MRLFRPLLAGANLPDRLLACAGALLGVTVAGLVGAALTPWPHGTIAIVAPLGASAVLVFAVPASPLAQPWPVLGGNVVSALLGMVVAGLVRQPALAAGLAVAVAILAMSLLRCLHPPGGAAALTAVLGGPAVDAAGWWFPLLPVAINSLALVGSGWLFHRVSGHAYPHRPAPVPASLLHPDDIDRALAEADDAFDIAPGDLAALLALAEEHAARRRAGR